MDEHLRSAKSRGYEMRKRAEDVDRTRRRIVEAAVHLHGTAGPAATSITAIAKQAGVTRLTVYRHFPEELALFAACSGHWLSQQALPQPQDWGRIADPVARLRAGLSDIYRFYREGEQMLTRVIRDEHAMPQQIREAHKAMIEQYVEAMATAWTDRDDRVRRALIGHAAAFSTWHSLCREHGLADREAAAAMVTLAQAVAAEH